MLTELTALLITQTAFWSEARVNKIPTTSAIPDVARQTPSPKIVRVTAAQVQTEQIAGSWFHTLSLKAANQTEGNVTRIVVNYEIYAANTTRLVAAGKANLQPQNLLPNEEAQAQIMVDQGGRVKVTLVEWVSSDQGYKSFEQMEEFPAP